MFARGVTQSNLENTWKIYQRSGHALAYFKNDQLGRQWKPLGVMMMLLLLFLFLLPLLLLLQLLLSKVWQYMKSHQLNSIDMYVALMGSSQPSSHQQFRNQKKIHRPRVHSSPQSGPILLSSVGQFSANSSKLDPWQDDTHLGWTKNPYKLSWTTKKYIPFYWLIQRGYKNPY